MYHHVKKLMYTVRVDEPDPRFGNMLLEQFGGANGELAAAMQYSIQGLNCEDPERKDLLMDVGTEELSHLEVVGSLARLHLKPMKFDREKAEADPLIAIAGGGGVNLFNSQGNPWTADYLKIAQCVGDLFKATGWHFAIGVQEPKRVAQRGPRSGVHLGRATTRSV
jgi:Mn-containing catalase